ncbi:hypothetical protein AVEN_129135-1 [Araneus ventricosus]|uniref:Uncharacterized protein n=1 Tax=Araneus ventricosus TaxID=182803 RepID=A0A4Y2PJ46_ARAVE|nr:hypothetical protein AVEN_129135-1 [Araneus ventricosus]
MMCNAGMTLEFARQGAPLAVRGEFAPICPTGGTTCRTGRVCPDFPTGGTTCRTERVCPDLPDRGHDLPYGTSLSRFSRQGARPAVRDEFAPICPTGGRTSRGMGRRSVRDDECNEKEY